MELTYARWLAGCTAAALAVLVAAFVAYGLGLLEPLIAPAALPQLWQLPLAEFLAITGAPTGWQWLSALTKGDYANFLGIGMLGSVTLACYLRVLLQLISRGERWLAALAACQIAVLAAAASGVLTGGY